MPMQIRRATAEDAHRIAEIHVEASRVAYCEIVPDAVLQRQSVEKREAFWSRQIANELSHTLVAEDGGVVGWIDFGNTRDADSVGDAEVYTIYLDPRHVRRGIGSALWRAMLEEAKQAGWSRIAAWVLRENHPARRFYEAVGGTPGGSASDERIEVFGSVELREVRYWFGK